MISSRGAQEVHRLGLVSSASPVSSVISDFRQGNLHQASRQSVRVIYVVSKSKISRFNTGSQVQRHINSKRRIRREMLCATFLSFTLRELHDVIPVTMGWEGIHLVMARSNCPLPRLTRRWRRCYVAMARGGSTPWFTVCVSRIGRRQQV
jgi:hypothetical protein